MTQIELIRTAARVAVVLTLTSAACNRKSSGPELQTTTGTQARNDAVNVTGCLRQGLGDKTFVLAAIDTSGASTDPTTNYRLTGNKVALGDYTGQQVQVTGTVRAEQEVASRGVAEAEKPAKGTSGTPTVEVDTEIDMKELSVDSLKPTGERCAASAPSQKDQPPKRIK